MTLLEEIQTAAVDSSTDLAALLRKCKLLAVRLGNRELEVWAQHESGGYPDDAPVPEYRKWSIALKGTFSGPMGASIKNAPIPYAVLPEKVRKSYQDYECRQSVASIQGLLEDNRNGVLSVVTGDLALFLGGDVYRGYNCVHAWGEFGTMALMEVVNAVRNRVLDFAIALWKEAPTAGELGSPAQTIGAQRVTQIFNTTVFGGAANLVGTADSSTINFNIGLHDLEALRKVLAANSVEPKDIVELESALLAEPQAPAPGRFGPRVTAWIAAMISKASTGAWAVGLGAAGNLLASAIGKYYGLPN